MNHEHIGSIGWLSLAAGVVAWDLTQEETLTNAFRRGYENPHYRPLILGAMAVTAAHLIGAIPEEIDPFHRGLDFLQNLINQGGTSS